MHKISTALLIISVGLLVCAVVNFAPAGHTVEILDYFKIEPSLPFSKGERLTYEVRYNKLKAGESILTFHGEEDLDNKKVYHISFSTKLAAIEDIEELYGDKESFLPQEVQRVVKRFGGFNTSIKEKYDQENFRVDIKGKNRLISREFSIKKSSPIHNAILLAYYYRTKKDFSKSERFKVNLPTAEFELVFKGKELVETPLGKYTAYIFTSNPEKFNLWLSADERRIPLKIQNLGALGYSLVIKAVD